MGGRKSRNKGKVGEREFFNLLNDALGGVYFRRNLIQTRLGGCDSDTDLDQAIEVKRQEKLSLTSWIRQTLEQAVDVGKQPVLAYRQSREPWQVWVGMTLEEYTEYVNERIPSGVRVVAERALADKRSQLGATAAHDQNGSDVSGRSDGDSDDSGNHS